jgi:hypothetical protein
MIPRPVSLAVVLAVAIASPAAAASPTVKAVDA